ncbi:MAG: sigma-70 family RNA polymerase sigma factor [Solirubrobacterales bacterium]
MSEAAAATGLGRWQSDERLTRRACSGDERAFAAIFRRYHQPLYRFCLAIVANPEDAQDALQNTMVKVMRALPGEERTIDLKPWLYRIAHNEAIDLLRRRRETGQLDVEQAAPGYGVAEDAATRERLRRLLTDLGELPERQREVLVMRELGGLGFGEIGAALDTTGAVARQTLYEARQSLRQMEEGREMGCDEVSRALSDGDGRVTRRRDVRAHLRSCAGCRAFREEIATRHRDLAAISPLPAAAVAGMVQGLVGGSGASGGGGLAAALGGGAAKTISASAAAKGVATVAVVAAVGVGTADRTGAIHLGLPGESHSQPASSAPPVPAGVHQGSPAPASAPGHEAAGNGTGPGRADTGNSQGAGAKGAGAARGHGQTETAAHAGGGVHGHKNESAGNQSPGAPAEHPAGHGEEKQLPSAAAGGQEMAAEGGRPEDDSGEDAKSESPSAEKAPQSEHGHGQSNSPPGQEAKEPPANPPPAAAPESPGQAPPQTPPKGKGPDGQGPPGAASSPAKADIVASVDSARAGSA